MERELRRFASLRRSDKCEVPTQTLDSGPEMSMVAGRELGRRTVLASFVAAGVSAPFYRSMPDAVVPSSSSRRSHSTSTATALSSPSALVPFFSPRLAGEGLWKPAGRLVNGLQAVYATTLRPPDTPAAKAGVAWMDTNLLSARLYSGSLSPGGLNWKYTAPVSPSAARTLVAAFNGGFLMKDSRGGYFSEGRLVAPLRRGGASLVIYSDGSATVGMWGRDVNMTPSVVAVRQNLTLLVDHGTLVPGLQRYDIKTWGEALGGVVDTPRSGLGVTAHGALVYAEGPMTIIDLALVLVRAGSVRAMALDMNPLWPVFASYTPATLGGAATPANGRDLNSSMEQTPARFFEAAYARDFITMSAA